MATVSTLIGRDYDDVLLVPQYSSIESRVQVSLKTQVGEFSLDLPIISANMDSVTEVAMAKAMSTQGGLGILHRYADVPVVKSWIRELYGFNYALSVGVKRDDYLAAEIYKSCGVNAICIDIAHGDSKMACDMVSHCESLGFGTIIAGNVATASGACRLYDAGANVIKVGVGPGSVCITRTVTGCGVPQLTALMDVNDIFRNRGYEFVGRPVQIIADGGIRYSGDIVKALAAGADCVMLGSLLAGTAESPGNMVKWQGRTFKEYRGMGSLKAMRKGAGDRYGQNSSGKLVPEGVEARVPFKGPLADVVFQLMGGLRSGMGYVGAGTLDDLRAKARFVRITAGGLKESHPHDVVITEEPVNYEPA
jgi:IMP dehydrogenase